MKLPALTSLRFFAAALVVGIHYAETMGGHTSLRLLIAGQHVVSFFFVLSGFILCHVYPDLKTWRERSGFMATRLGRVYPTHLACLALLLILVPTARDGVLAGPGTFIANLTLIQSWFPQASYHYSFNSPAWSISVEVFFYVCFIWLIVNWRRNWPIKLGLTLAMLAVAVFAVSRGLPVSSGGLDEISADGVLLANPLVRLLEFEFGMVCCLAWRWVAARWRPNLAKGTAVELLSIAAWFGTVWYAKHWVPTIAKLCHLPSGGSIWLWQGGIAVPACGLLIVVMALRAGWISRTISHPVLVFLGEMTYSLYLIHWPLLRWFSDHASQLAGWPGWLRCAGYWLITLVSTYLMWRLVERPCRKFKRHRQHLRLPASLSEPIKLAA